MIPTALHGVVGEVVAWVIAESGETLADVDAELAALGFETWRIGLETLAAWRVAPTLALVIGSVDLDSVHARRACLSLRGNPLLAQVPILVAMPERRMPIADPALADYELIVRPLRDGELPARIDRARAAAAAAADPVDVSLRAGDLRLDPRRRVAWVGPRPVALSVREFELVLFLARHPARVYSRAQLLHAVWGVRGAAVGGRAVDVLVRRVRAKLGDEHSGCIARSAASATRSTRRRPRRRRCTRPELPATTFLDAPQRNAAALTRGPSCRPPRSLTRRRPRRRRLPGARAAARHVPRRTAGQGGGAGRVLS